MLRTSIFVFKQNVSFVIFLCFASIFGSFSRIQNVEIRCPFLQTRHYASSSAPSVKMWIDGQPVASKSNKSVELTNPVGKIKVLFGFNFFSNAGHERSHLARSTVYTGGNANGCRIGEKGIQFMETCQRTAATTVHVQAGRFD
jgi:hypothetical protein